MGYSVKVKLNSANIKNLLQSDSTIHDIIDDSGARVEKEMETASMDSRMMAVGDGKEVPPATQKAFKRDGEVRDRQRVLVGIDNAQDYDYVYGTVPKAVEAAGGKKV